MDNHDFECEPEGENFTTKDVITIKQEVDVMDETIKDQQCSQMDFIEEVEPEHEDFTIKDEITIEETELNVALENSDSNKIKQEPDFGERPLTNAQEDTYQTNIQSKNDEDMSSQDAGECTNFEDDIDQNEEMQIKDEITIEEAKVNIGDETGDDDEEDDNDKEVENDDDENDRKFKCNVCDNRCKTYAAYTLHMIDSHPDERVAVCRICRLQIKGESIYRQHLLEQHEGYDNVCKICLELYHGTGQTKDQQHLKICSGRLLFNCKKCRKKYVKKEGLLKHLETHSIPEDTKMSSITEQRIKEQFFNCVICADDLAYKKDPYWKHIKKTHQGNHIRCTYCPKLFKAMSPCVKHMGKECRAGPALERYVMQDKKCPECSKIYPNQSSLETHIKMIHRRKIVTCEICKLDFKGHAAFNYHKKIKHTKPKLSCSYCPQKFHIPSGLKRHMELHQNERKTLCTQCGLSFPNKGSLRTHIRCRHQTDAEAGKKATKKSKFECTECTKSFRHRNNYENHMQLHKTDLQNDRKLFCEDCKIDFVTVHAMNSHLNRSVIHKKVKCKKCKIMFANAWKYDEHIRNKTCKKT